MPSRDSKVGVTVDRDVHASERGGDRCELTGDFEFGGDGGLNLTHEGHGLREIIFVAVHEDLIRVKGCIVRDVVNSDAGVYVTLGPGAGEGGVDDAFEGLHELVSVRMVVGTIVEELAEKVANAVVIVDVEAHHFIDKVFRSVVSLVRDDVVVALKKDGDWEVAAKVHVFGVACESRDVRNVRAAGIGTGSDSLKELDEEIGDIEVEEEGLEIEEFGGVQEPGVHRRSRTSFEIAEKIECIDDKKEVGGQGRRRYLRMLLKIERIIELGSIKTHSHEDWAEIALEIDGGMVAIGGGVFDVDGHLSEERVGGSRGRSGSLGDIFLVFKLEAFKLGRSLEIECAGGGHVDCVESGNKSFLEQVE
jgi:hypothetical protein